MPPHRDRRPDIRAKNSRWFAEHPTWNRRTDLASAADLALAVVHWHHNAEISERFGTLDSQGGSGADLDRRTCREYARLATIQWLAEFKKEVDDYPDGHAHWRSAGGDILSRNRFAVEICIRNLQVALDAFAFNDAARRK